MELEIDGRAKGCVGLIAELESAMRQDGTSVLHVTVRDIPTKIDLYAWAKRKGHTVAREARAGDSFRIDVLR